MSVEAQRRSVPPAFPRWLAATICFLYGFAKINGSQFTVLDSELSRPMGEVSGFWLTWYYFGYSKTYGTLIALTQIVAGGLLLMPRTSLLGALVLLPVAANIVLVDIFYGVDLGGTFMAAILLVCVVLILAPSARHLWHSAQLRDAPARPSRLAVAAGLAMLVGAFTLTWWLANYNNRVPTPIEGVWEVVAAPDGQPPAWRTVYFERNRAHLAVFRPAAGPDARHHFEVDTDGAIRVWRDWLTRGPLVAQGRRLGDDRIELSLTSDGARLLLERRDTDR